MPETPARTTVTSISQRRRRAERRPRGAVHAFVAAARTLAAVSACACALIPGTAHADRSVTIAAGDTLSGIAAAHGTTIEAIVARNGLPSADLIFLGQRLQVPGGAATTARATTVGATALVAAAVDGIGQGGADSEVTHTVAPGETLFAIAIAYQAKVREIVAANGLGRADFVQAGQALIIPNARRAPLPSAATAGRDAAVAALEGEPEGESGGSAAAMGDGSRRIVVDLSDQTLSAYVGAQRVNSFIVSSGSPWTPTPLGTFAVYGRYESQRMVGPGYDLAGVPHVQYFSGAYAIHGAYWHQSFGVPISHGCINLQLGDAAWLWRWADVGTPVIVEP